MKNTKIVKTNKREDIDKIKEIESKHGWKMLSYTYVDDKYELEFIKTSNERFEALKRIIYILSILSIIGLGGIFSTGFVIALLWTAYNLGEAMMILFICFLCIGFVGFILALIAFILYKKNATPNSFLIVGLFITLLGNIFFGPALIIYSKRLKENVKKEQ